MLAAEERDVEQELADRLCGFRYDPLGAVLYGFPWGEEGGDLADSAGPRKWQRDVLEYIGQWLQNPATRYQPCRVAISSGHDIGKSSLIAMIDWWAMSTSRDPRGNITANTDNQLKTKTSPELAKWWRLAINADWFEKTVTSIKVRDPKHSETWRTDLVPWSEDNPAAAAGLHNKGRVLLFIIDEASEVPQIIFDTAEGVMLDENTIIIFLVCGNPSRNMGPFYDVVFGERRGRWKPYIIDSREVEGTNKAELAEWEKEYGEDSDFFRVRARGLPPRASSAQYIDQDLIVNAQKRAPRCLPDDPLVAGVDFAWGGSDDNVIRFRKGFDAKSIPPIKIKGEFTRDPAVMVGKLADVLSKSYNGQKLSMLFLDSAGIAAPVEARLRALGHMNLMVVNFGADSPDKHYAYMRDFMWGQMKQWLLEGAIDADPRLGADLAKPILISDKLQRVKLEPKDAMKKRLAKLGVDSGSPDDGDALALTFSHAVVPAEPEAAPPRRRGTVWN